MAGEATEAAKHPKDEEETAGFNETSLRALYLQLQRLLKSTNLQSRADRHANNWPAKPSLQVKQSEDEDGFFRKELCWIRVQEAPKLSVPPPHRCPTCGRCPKCGEHVPTGGCKCPTCGYTRSSPNAVRIGGGYHVSEPYDCHSDRLRSPSPSQSPTARRVGFEEEDVASAGVAGLQSDLSSNERSVDAQTVQEASTSPPARRNYDSFAHGRPSGRLRYRGEGGTTYTFGAYTNGERRGQHGDRREVPGQLAFDETGVGKPPRGDGVFRVASAEPKQMHSNPQEVESPQDDALRELLAALDVHHSRHPMPPKIIRTRCNVGGRWAIDFCYIFGSSKPPKVKERTVYKVEERKVFVDREVEKIVEKPIETIVEKVIVKPVQVEKVIEKPILKYVERPGSQTRGLCKHVAVQASPDTDEVETQTDVVDIKANYPGLWMVVPKSWTSREKKMYGTGAAAAVRVGGGFEPVQPAIDDQGGNCWAAGPTQTRRPESAMHGRSTAVAAALASQETPRLAKVLAGARQIVREAVPVQTKTSSAAAARALPPRAAEAEVDAELDGFLHAVRTAKVDMQRRRLVENFPPPRAPWPMQQTGDPEPQDAGPSSALATPNPPPRHGDAVYYSRTDRGLEMSATADGFRDWVAGELAKGATIDQLVSRAGENDRPVSAAAYKVNARTRPLLVGVQSSAVATV